MRGTIAVIIADKGYGFISPREGDRDIFFHASGLAQGLEFNEALFARDVTFDVEATDKGPRAINVQGL